MDEKVLYEAKLTLFNKVKSCEELKKLAVQFKIEGKSIVFTNGCFDILHIGHIFNLYHSKQMGDILIVGINSDASVKRLKGEGRPAIPEKDRAIVLSALSLVDYVTIFSEDTPLNLISCLQPAVYTKGKDYVESQAIGQGFGKEVIEAYGGRVELIPLLDESTTAIMKRI